MNDQADQGPSMAESTLSEQIEQNIQSVAALQRREWETTTVSQRRVERVSRFMGRPTYLVALVALAVLWVVINGIGPWFSGNRWDAPPFELLDSIMTFVSLLTTTIVLVAQNRQSKLEQQHAHLDLQVNLLTEQKVTKLIHLIEELRRDLPMVKDRHDPHATALQQPTNTAEVLSAIDEVGLAGDVTNAGTPIGRN